MDGTRGPWDGGAYQKKFDELAASGTEVHGEVDFVMQLGPKSVLDAGCGTGRVARELAARGVDVVGVDVNESMIATARERDPDLVWLVADVGGLELDRRFDVVVMAGNVPLFTPPDTHAALVAGCARHLATGGFLVSGFSLRRGYELADYDAHCGAAGLALTARVSTWDGAPFSDEAPYAVSVHEQRPTYRNTL